VDAGSEQRFNMLGRGTDIEGLIVAELSRDRGIDTVPICLEVRNGWFLL